MKINIVTLPYNVQGKGRGGASGPDALLSAGLVESLAERGHTVSEPTAIALTTEEENQYGGWNRVTLANSHLCDAVSLIAQDESTFVLGLLADCNGVLGVLGGLQKGDHPLRPRRVGLVYIDAHGDYNTPETSPSGMLGGMPVAVAAGKALHNLRLGSGIKVPLQSPDIVLAGMRDLDPPERAMIEADGLAVIRESDLIEQSPALHEAMEYLSRREDVIYVHVDLDILDPGVAPAAGLPSPGGLTGKQLGKALAAMLSYPKVRALACVSYNSDADKDGRTLEEVARAIVDGVEPLKGRQSM